MDFINKSYGQVVELFRTMTPAGRIMTGLLLSLVIMSLVFLFRQQTDRAEEYLFGAELLTNNEISAVAAAFSKHGLQAWDTTGNRVRVPRSQKHTYMAAAAEEGAIPASFGNAWDKMLKEGSSFDPRDTREVRVRNAMEQEAEKTLRQMRDIVHARVTITESTTDGFPPRKEKQAVAAVGALGNKPLDEDQVRMIRYTVAPAAGVKPEDVTVTDLNGGVYPGAGKDGGLSEFQNLYAAHQRQFSNFYKQQISEALLSAYPGVKVAVSVELEKELRSQTDSYKYDDKPTAIQSTVQTKELTSKSGGPGGPPGAGSNGVGNKGTQLTSVESTNESTTNENREDQKNVVGATHISTQKAPLVPVSITASISVPTSHFLKVWQVRNPPVKGEAPKTPSTDELKQIETEEINNIQTIVANILPRPPQGDKYTPVKVVPFTETPSMPLEDPTLASTAFSWFAENWQTIGLFILAAAGVVFLRGMIRAAQQAPLAEPAAYVRDSQTAHSSTADTAEPEQSVETNESVATTLKRRFQSSGHSLRDELTVLVREDPDAAANILKLWISDAA